MNLFIKYGTKFYQEGLNIPSEYLQQFKNAVADDWTFELSTLIKDNIEITNNKNDRVYKQDIYDLLSGYDIEAIRKQFDILCIKYVKNKHVSGDKLKQLGVFVGIKIIIEEK